MQQHERDDSLVDLLDPDLARRDSFHVEKGKSKRWGQKRRLQVDGHQRQEPEGDVFGRDVIAEIKTGYQGRKYRQHDQSDLDPVEKKAEHEGDRHE